MFFDTFFIFLNVLEQFAIRVNIFWVDIDLDDVIKYVNKLYFRTNDDFIKNLIEEAVSKNPDLAHINPKLVVKESLKDIDKKIINDAIFNEYASIKLNYVKDIHFRYIY